MDIKINYNAQALTFEMAVENGDLAIDNGLVTAVLMSLFTDRRANADDVIPDGTDDRRGWWADAYPEVAGDLVGSRLWLLDREKQLPDVLERAKGYAEEALAWLVEDGVARAVVATAVWAGPGLLGLTVVVTMVAGSRFSMAINYPVEV